MILHWILQHLISTVALAATVMPALGASDGAGAIINTDGGDGGADTTQDTDATDGDDSTDGGEETEGVEGKPTPKPEEKLDLKNVSSEVKAHIQQMAKTNPKLANLLQNAVYTSSSFLKEVPGGVKEIRQLKQDIEQLGGMEEIRTLKQTHKSLVEEQEALDTSARNGDPEVLDNLVEIAGKEGFSKLMPSALGKWAAHDQPGYSHEMSKIMVSALREGGVVSDLNLAFKMLSLNSPEATKEAVECLKRAAEWANKINELAVKAPVRPQVDPQVAEQQRSLETQRTQLFNDQFSSKFGQWRASEISREVSQVVAGRTLNEYQMQTLNERIISDIKQILTADSDYMKNLEKIYNSRNLDDLMKFAKARTAKILPEVSKKAYRSLFSGTAGPKKVAKPPVQTDKTATAVTPQKGWQKIEVSKAPSPDEIDSKKTTFEMKFRKQAILKNGQQVYWGSAVPK